MKGTMLQSPKEVYSMQTRWNIKKQICILLAFCYILLGMCFDTIETDSLLDYPESNCKAKIHGFVFAKKSVSAISGDSFEFSNEDVSFQTREKSGKGRFCHSSFGMVFLSLFLYLTYICRWLLCRSTLFVISKLRKIICYIHKKDGKKHSSMLFA